MLIYLGQAYSAHGIKGGLKAHLASGKHTVLRAGMKLQDQKGVIRAIIQLIPREKDCILYLEGIEDRTQVDGLLPLSLYIEREDLPPLPSGEHYQNDLIGREVCTEDGQVWGRVHSFSDNGAHGIMSVQSLEGPLVELPFVPEFIKSIEDDRILAIRPEYVE